MALLLSWHGEPVYAGGVVGDGTPTSCDGNALTAALAGSGTVTFNCGAQPHTILVDTMVIGMGASVRVDGEGLITLSAENLRQIFIVDEGGALILANITLAHGNWFGNGGAITNYGTLTLEQSTIRNSRAEGQESMGGAISNQGGVVTLVGSQLLENQAEYGGGGVENSGGTLILDNSVVRSNSANNFAGVYSTGVLEIRNGTVVEENSATTGMGGGVGIFGGRATLDGVTIRGNSALEGLGGGLALVAGETLIQESEVSENLAGDGGGGIYINPNYAAAVTIRASSISENATTRQESPDNSINAFGGGIYNGAGLTLEQVSVRDNRAASGGGLFNYQTTSKLTVRNSTFAGNSATHVAGGLWLNANQAQSLVNVTVSGNQAAGYGGGLLVDGPAVLTNVTLADNQAPVGANLYNRGPATLANTILAGPLESGNCGFADPPAPVISAGFNLDEDGSCSLASTGDQSNVAAQLGPLAENGGATATHLPQAGSPARDAGNDALCPATDQRGYSRPAADLCDIGAVDADAQAGAPPTASPEPTEPPLPPVVSTPEPPPYSHADLAQGEQPSVGMDREEGYAGLEVNVFGQGVAGSPGVRLSWVIGERSYAVREVVVDNDLNYTAKVQVPAGLPPGAAEFCAAATDMAFGEYGCTSFTITDPPAGGLSGQIPAASLASAPVQVHLLDAAGKSLYSTTTDMTGRFQFAGVTPGFYSYAVTGNLSQAVGGGVAKITPGANSLLERDFNLAGLLADPCIFGGGGSMGADPSHPTFAQLIARDTVASLRSVSLNLPVQAAQSSAALDTNLSSSYFGIYMTGVPLDVLFSADPQVRSGETVARVEFAIITAGDREFTLPADVDAPYRSSFNVGALPAGMHKVRAIARNAAGQNIGGICKDLVVVSGILPQGLTAADASGAGVDSALETGALLSPAEVAAAGIAQAGPAEVNEIQRGFVRNNAVPGRSYYFVRGYVPYGNWQPPARYPNPPPTWPVVGVVDNRLGLNMYVDVRMYLDGTVDFNLVRADLYAMLLSMELCNTAKPLISNYRTQISYQNPNGLYIPFDGGTLCSFNRERTLFRGEVESLWGLLAFGVNLRVRMDGSISLYGSMRPMAQDFRANSFVYVQPAAIVDGWVRLLWGVAGGGITPWANAVAFANADINTTRSPALQAGACAAMQVWVSVWARVNYLVGSKTWNVWNKRLLTESTCVAAADLLADEPPVTPPRVIAAPALATSPGGATLSVYVEDATPNGDLPSPRIMARFRAADDAPWTEATALDQGTRYVQDPAAVFYGPDKALVAWTETFITPAEEAAAGDDLSAILRRQEIVYALWDGSSWSAPLRFTDDAAADGSATLAAQGNAVTLAWVRDVDGYLATRTDWRIATGQFDGAAGQWTAAYLLDAGSTLQRNGAAGGLNAEVKLVYDPNAAEPTVYATWTYDGDGELTTGLDRQVVVARWNVADEVALNPQPLPPKDWAALNPQPLPPKDWVLLNPQPLPPRIQSPTLSFAGDRLRLAFVVNPPDGQGQEAVSALGGDVWVAIQGPDDVTWQAQGLQDDQGNQVVGETPVFAQRGNEQLLLFRRFGEEGTTGQLGQLSISRMVGVGAPSTPLYVTSDLHQNWQGALAVNPISGRAQIAKVSRLVGSVEAAALPMVNAAQAQVNTSVTRISAAGDPVETLEIGEGADPGLDGLTFAPRAAAAGAPVTLQVTVRNVGRGRTGEVTVNLFAGEPGSGVLLGSATVAAGLTLNESRVVNFNVVAPGGAGDIYAQLATDGMNGSEKNDLVAGQLGKPSTPTPVSLGEDDLFDGNLRLAWLGWDGENVAGYRIYRSSAAAGPYEFLSESRETNFTDLLSRRGESYCYQVRAYTAESIVSDAGAPLCGGLLEFATYLPLTGR